MGKVDEKKERKRRALEDAAFELFCEKGLVNTSISDIVEKAGVAKGTFYLYFNDKYDVANLLVYTITGKVFKNAMDALSRTKILTPEDEMVMISEHIINQLTKDPTLLNYYTKAISWTRFKENVQIAKDDGIYDFNLLFQDMKVRYFKYDLIEPEVMVFMITEFVLSTCYSPIVEQQPMPIDKMKPFILNTVRDIVKAHKGCRTFNG